jgi:uncharacterized membrane protein
MSDKTPIRTGRAFDRLINFTDAVTAVAITVLVLPIVELRQQAAEKTVWQVISDNSGVLITFTFTFAVVAYMWLTHNRIFNRLIGYDGRIYFYNFMWLFLIVLLPWTSALYSDGIGGGVGYQDSNFSGGEGMGGAGLLYWGNLALVSVFGWLIVYHAKKNPELINQDVNRVFKDVPLVHYRGLIFAAAMLSIGLVSLFAPTVSWWLPLGLLPLGIFMSRFEVRNG